MKLFLICLVFFLYIPAGYSQDVLSKYDLTQTLPPEVAGDVIKLIWDETREFAIQSADLQQSKNEFESTADFVTRVQKSRDEISSKARKISLDSKLATRVISVYLDAELKRYDADKETYSIVSTHSVPVPPSKEFMKFECIANQYIDSFEKDENGYRRAYFSLKGKPDFTWYVNSKTAREAKEREHNITFKLWFKLALDTSNPNQYVLQMIPIRISLMDKVENFTYWTEEIN